MIKRLEGGEIMASLKQQYLENMKIRTNNKLTPLHEEIGQLIGLFEISHFSQENIEYTREFMAIVRWRFTKHPNYRKPPLLPDGETFNYHSSVMKQGIMKG